MLKKSFFKIGIIDSVPWSFISPEEKKWSGFCIDLIRALADIMNFEYELVLCKDADTLEIENGEEGILHDITNDKIDIAVAPLSMTAARAELVDFITPYFENSGLSIVIRKPVRKSSFFMFMTVLNLEVWLCIFKTVVITALIIWLIDKCSPTCKRLNKWGQVERKFTFRESMWYAITTFTTQGTGEIPSSPPHKVLIAAYWIFVLVMMTTFTANLAAFLTVERLKAPISSVGELAHQNKINFTVVQNSQAHFYFKNMKFAEDTLFKIWRDLALTRPKSNEKSFRVWDYPIKEEYRHILKRIERNQPVPNATIGFQKVLENENGEFALIHDTSEIRFHVFRDCRFIEIGDIFGERPFSIAIKKNSEIKNEIKNRILDLYEERYFESLGAKYWNTSNLASCSADDGDTEAVTLDNLGGVFVAVFCGMILSLLMLLIEIFCFINKNKNKCRKQLPRLMFYKLKEKRSQIMQIKLLQKQSKVMKNRLKIPTHRQF